MCLLRPWLLLNLIMQMPSLDNIKGVFNRAPADAVGIQFSSNGTCAVRMKKSGDSLSLISASALPPVPFPLTVNPSAEPLALPARVRGRFAALNCPAENGAVKLLRAPEGFNTDNRQEVLDRLAFDHPDPVRTAAKVLLPGAAKSEARILASAMPERTAKALLSLMPAVGIPAPRALELSELAVINAFHNDPQFKDSEQAYGLIHFDCDFSVIALFNNNVLSQFRIFGFGMAALTRKVMQSLNVDEATAEGVLMDGAFDISHLIEDGAREMRSQLVISRDFMERSENCLLEKTYVSGPPALIKPFAAGMPGAESLIEWDVLGAFKDTPADAIGEEFGTNTWRLAAAIGSAMGVLLPA